MKKFSRLTRISLLLAALFGADKLLGILRTVIIGRQFGLSEELDVFNAANNLPDLLFALISGGALAIAFIPVLSEVLNREGRDSTWRLFSRVANLAFIVTSILAVLVGLLAEPIIRGELGIAPGFSPDQQTLAIRLMRLHLISTMIFSLSGLVMAGLQANQHFLLPAIAPLIYDIGQIIGAVILAPQEGYQIGGISLPAFGMGINGLVYGVILGAALHLLVQVPGLIRFEFKWFPILGFKDKAFRRVIALMGPRLASMVFIQMIFLARDNLASRLVTGSVTALSFGWWIQQVPETLIGTAIATALLPTLSEHTAAGEYQAFKQIIERALRVMIALSLPITAILSLASLPWIQVAFGYPVEGSQLILRAAQGYLIGLLGHSVVELGVRAFYARENARVPMLVSALGFLIYTGLAVVLMNPLGAGGIALANSISYSVQAIALIVLLNRQIVQRFRLGKTFLRAGLSMLLAGGCTYLVFAILPIPLPVLLLSLGSMLVGLIAGVIPIWPEIRLLVKL